MSTKFPETCRCLPMDAEIEAYVTVFTADGACRVFDLFSIC